MKLSPATTATLSSLADATPAAAASEPKAGGTKAGE
jgi:hypothetical protein